MFKIDYRILYWSNENFHSPNIEMCKLNDNNRTRINIRTRNLYIPRGLFLDLKNNYLYWAHEAEGISISMERIQLYHSNSEEVSFGSPEAVFTSHSHTPYSVAVVNNSKLYWTDDTNRAVWDIDLR
jgi:hypothetical protein